MNYLLNIDDSLIIAMMQVFLDLRCSKISWMLIMYFDFIPYCLSKIALRVMIGYTLRCSKVIEYPPKDSPLPIEKENTHSLLSGSLLRNL